MLGLLLPTHVDLGHAGCFSDFGKCLYSEAPEYRWLLTGERHEVNVVISHSRPAYLSAVFIFDNHAAIALPALTNPAPSAG